ncbi:hypothetical protein MTO96_000567 [Rhipicephalus appendiculatus]
MLCPRVLNHGWLDIALGTAAGSITGRLERRSGPAGSSRARRLGNQEKNRRNKWQAAASARAVLSAASPSQEAALCATSRRQQLADVCTFCSILIVTFQQNLLRMLPNTRKRCCFSGSWTRWC